MPNKKENKEEKEDKIEINENCPCPEIDCERHGNCRLCKAYHHSLGQSTFCRK